MATTLHPVTRYRNYKGPCRSCKAPEMVLCTPDCKYVDPWADYYMGPRERDRLRAKAIKAKEEASGNVRKVSFTGPSDSTNSSNTTAKKTTQKRRKA